MTVQMTALLIVFMIGYFGMLAIKLGGFVKNNKKLGEMIYAAPKGLQNTDFAWQLLYLGLIIAGILILDFMHFLNETIFFYLIGLIGVYFGFATYSLFMCVLGGRGMYEWGVRTMTGALTYDKMESYEIEQRKKQKGLSVKYKPKSGFLNATQIMFIDYEDNDEINRISRLNVGKEKGKSAYAYAPKPNKKKRGKRKK
ncbi:hypothetical protein [Anaerofustis stercorihominis]|uniref:Uncharacterized protein n=2 Tax=Anaerofustis stercorihominis TaxID=214853 RepID=B1C6F7_9FIRM|nr:hypothetical protein [Anaerofustis stercorihominis]EDS73442.1 hypothetical protein ANASTE_00297 [Anaerofustis stercorihominis DSM 17244]MCQ4794962.1 hypothetical protein [Anaerofustis stercorihominis]RGD75469.1 hypothetical protein DW687_03855 [Anaerofustis stercorihominis]